MASEERRGARTVARECALMMLFGIEAAGTDPKNASRDFFVELAGDAGLTTDEEARTYAREIAEGVRDGLERLDGIIKQASENWRLERMSRVDRNVLRIGVWELETGVPRPVTIDEAVELAKRFGTADSGAFVNGILDRVAENLGIR
jgi:N utilization substance protein B